MPNIELERVNIPCEFEERASLFMADVALAENGFPDLQIDVVNKTLVELEANEWAVRKSRELKKTAMYEKAFERGIDKDLASTVQTVIMIQIHSAKRARIEEFKKKIEESAKKFNGIKEDEDSNSDPDPSSEYKYFSYVDYAFRG